VLFGYLFGERKEMVSRIGAGTTKKFFFGISIIAHQIAHAGIVVKRIGFQRSVDLALLDQFHRMLTGSWRRNKIHSYIGRRRPQTFLGDVRLSYIPLDVLGLNTEFVL